MAQRYVPPHVQFIYDLQEVTTPEDWTCSICMEPALDEQDGNIKEVAQNTVKMACGHTFHLGCLYIWVAGDEIQQGLKKNKTCPICRAKLFDGYYEDDDEDDDDGEDIRFRAGQFFDRTNIQFLAPYWHNQNAADWLTQSLQEYTHVTVYADHNWVEIIRTLIQVSTADDGRFVGDAIVGEAQRSFLDDGHERYGRLWLEIFLALRIYNTAYNNNWERRERWREFESYLADIGEDFIGRVEQFAYVYDDHVYEGD